LHVMALGAKGILALEPQLVRIATAEIAKALCTLEDVLRQRLHIVGSSLSLADVCTCCYLAEAVGISGSDDPVLHPTLLEDIPCVCRWFNGCMALPAFREVLGDLSLPESDFPSLDQPVLETAKVEVFELKAASNDAGLKAILIAHKYTSLQLNGPTDPDPLHWTSCFREKVPYLEVDTAHTVFGCLPIMRFLWEHRVKNEVATYEATMCNSWLEWVDLELGPYCTYSRDFSDDQERRGLVGCLGILNSHLQSRKRIAGERESLADIYMCCLLLEVKRHWADATRDVPAVQAWLDECTQLPEFLAVLGSDLKNEDDESDEDE